MLKSFTGFRGSAALCQIGDLTFLLVAENAAQLETLYTALLPQAGPFNRTACKPSIVIASTELPQSKSPKHEHKKTDQSPKAEDRT